MTSTEEVTAEQAPRPPAEAIAMWLRLTNGDEYGALLCATAATATVIALDAAESNMSNREARVLLAARRTRDEARADVAQYYGETLADQHPAVRRAAGFRS